MSGCNNDGGTSSALNESSESLSSVEDESIAGTAITDSTSHNIGEPEKFDITKILKKYDILEIYDSPQAVKAKIAELENEFDNMGSQIYNSVVSGEEREAMIYKRRDLTNIINYLKGLLDTAFEYEGEELYNKKVEEFYSYVDGVYVISPVAPEEIIKREQALVDKAQAIKADFDSGKITIDEAILRFNDEIGLSERSWAYKHYFVESSQNS